jgi:hypothetical protein
MYKIDITMKIQFTVWRNAKIFKAVRTQDYFITNIVVKMDTVGLTRELYNSRFLNVKFHVVLSTPMLYRVNVSLESFTVFNWLYVAIKFRSSANERNLECLTIAERSLTKILNKRGPRIDHCGAPDNRDKGDENFPKMRTKEDLFNK